ncbi:MAG: hypothetical protein ACMXYK_00565 [Candidatus Woesearchaeota archaeon]
MNDSDIDALRMTSKSIAFPLKDSMLFLEAGLNEKDGKALLFYSLEERFGNWEAADISGWIEEQTGFPYRGSFLGIQNNMVTQSYNCDEDFFTALPIQGIYEIRCTPFQGHASRKPLKMSAQVLLEKLVTDSEGNSLPKEELDRVLYSVKNVPGSILYFPEISKNCVLDQNIPKELLLFSQYLKRYGF